jgi:ferredoxin-type protein NapH
MKNKVRLPVLGAHQPARRWRWARRLTQALSFVAVVVAPFLGGWQRLDRNYLSAWDGHGWDLPPGLLDRLPLGDAPRRAYEINEVLGGGLAGRYFGVPAVDPVAGLLAFFGSGAPLRFAIAWLIPVVLGILAGRAFCGWFCPFGTVSRALDGLLDRLPLRPPRWRVPERRWLRWVLLATSVGLGTTTSQSLLYFVLPHLLVQQSGYALWLMSGGGAALGWLLGLVAAGIVFGPAAYCATLCPTGAALSLPSRVRARLVRVTITEPKRCGSHCELCSHACWLSLDPASGDPGPDCDVCARCFDVCPRTNLRIGITRGSRAVAAAAAALVFAISGDARANEPRGVDRARKPAMVLDAQTHHRDVRLVGSVIDLTGVKNDPDDLHELSGIRLSIVVMRGPPGTADQLGRLALRDVYSGPLDVELASGETTLAALHFDEPTSPSSTVRRAIYETTLPEVRLAPGDRVRIAPIAGWTEEPTTWLVPSPTAGTGLGRLGLAWATSFLLFGGLFALGLLQWPLRTTSARRPG